MSERLPIDRLRTAFDQAGRQPLVISAPTGSGKSTQVPRWAAARNGPVIVIEPRRVACRALAERVAMLEGCELGDGVGYRVRDDARATSQTRIQFVTPGIALRDDLSRFGAIILDEFHERRLDTDLLLALLRERFVNKEIESQLIVMSATLEGDRVAAYLGGTHLKGEGRTFPVDIQHQGDDVPSARELGSRVKRALAQTEGDALVFLPGKGEIARVAQVLENALDVRALHGSLSLKDQRRALASSSSGRRVILATNVAETSLTVPGIKVVIDSGLVRRTRYHQGRAYLTLASIGQDSADQRAGRAGRTQAGQCIRLWSRATRLDKTTPPEVHRESLVPLVLAAANAGVQASALELLDAPPAHALEDALRDLRALGALDGDAITQVGNQLFGLPIDPGLARLLVEAKDTPALGDVIDLCAALAAPPLFLRDARTDEDLRESGCDATALVRAVREGEPRRHGLSSAALAEARRTAKRLRKALDAEASEGDLERARLITLCLRADPRLAHVVRERKKRRALSNGGTELELARESATSRLKEGKLVAALVFGARAIGDGRERRIFATCVAPVTLRQLFDAKLGEERVSSVELKRKKIVANIERVYAKKVLGSFDGAPEGQAARDAIAELFLRGSIYKKARKESAARLSSFALYERLRTSRVGKNLGLEEVADAPKEATLKEWIALRLIELEVEHADDYELLSERDFLAPGLPEYLQEILDREFPRRLELGDTTYAIDYDLEKRQVMLREIKGHRKTPPPLSYLPKFAGFKIVVEAGRTMHVLRG